MTNKDRPMSQPAAPSAKRAWTEPKLTTMRASDAEAGANPINPEGAFAQGS